MAETVQEEQLAESQEISEAAPQEAPAVPPQESPEELPEEPKKEPGQSNILIPALTVLLILLGLGEAVFWGYFGLSAYSKSLARERYEQQQKAFAEEQDSKGIRGGSSYSPNLKVENGTVTWEREKWVYVGSSQPETTSNTSASTTRREDGLRLADLPVVRVPYLLAEPDTEEQLPSTQPETDGTAPTNA